MISWRQTLADFKNFGILKKQPDHQKSPDQQDEKDNSQQIEITLDKMPDRSAELIDKGCDQEKTGRA